MSTSVQAPRRPEAQAGGILGGALGSALLFSIPFLGLASGFPLVVQRLKRGLGSAVLASLLAAALLATVSQRPYQVAMFLGILVAPSLLMAESLARGRGLVRGCGWAFGLLLFELAIALVFVGPPLAEIWFLHPLDVMSSGQFLAGMKANGLSQESLDDWVQQVRLTRKALETVYPGAFVVLAGSLVLSNAALVRTYLARRDPGWLEIGEFESIRLPLGLVVAFVASGLSVLIPFVRPLSYNVLLVTAFFFFLQGLAVVGFFANRLAGPRFLRPVVVVLILAWAPQLLALLGLFDAFFDFRKWAETPKQGS
jgi:uncharacterized protein YybS (DUF2232 family)